MSNKLSTDEQDFLLDLANLIERHGGAEFYYTRNDDGVHIKIKGRPSDCFVGFDLAPENLRAAAS